MDQVKDEHISGSNECTSHFIDGLSLFMIGDTNLGINYHNLASDTSTDQSLYHCKVNININS